MPHKIAREMSRDEGVWDTQREVGLVAVVQQALDVIGLFVVDAFGGRGR